MDSETRNFVRRVLAENEQLEHTARLLFRLAATMQQVAEAEGHGFGLPPLGAELNDAMVVDMIRQLAVRQATAVPSPSASDTEAA
jgi:hypothetical protein